MVKFPRHQEVLSGVPHGAVLNLILSISCLNKQPPRSRKDIRRQTIHGRLSPIPPHQSEMKKNPWFSKLTFVILRLGNEMPDALPSTYLAGFCYDLNDIQGELRAWINGIYVL